MIQQWILQYNGFKGGSEIAKKKEAVLKEYDDETKRIESLCKKNFEEAVNFVIDDILGVKL